MFHKGGIIKIEVIIGLCSAVFCLPCQSRKPNVNGVSEGGALNDELSLVEYEGT